MSGTFYKRGAPIASDAVGELVFGVDSSGNAAAIGNDTVGAADAVVTRVTPSGAAQTLIAARATRRKATIVNHSNLDVHIGPATVTTANGFKLPVGASLEITDVGLTQMISTAVATGDVHVWDEF